MIGKILAVAAMGMAVATQASASGIASASLTSAGSSNGAVMVSHDGSFTPLLGSTGAMHQGDRVVVMKGGHASLTYADGCKVNLNSGSMVSVGSVSPCAGAGSAFQPVQGGDVDLPLAGPTPIIGAVIGVTAVAGIGVLIGGAYSGGLRDNTPAPVSP